MAAHRAEKEAFTGRGTVSGEWDGERVGLSIRCTKNETTGLWTAVGEDGTRTVTLTADTSDEASALVTEAFGFTAYRPPPPLPPEWQRFSLMHKPVTYHHPSFADPLYDAIKTRPPEGCEVKDWGGYFGLRCIRPGVTLLEAVGTLVAEIRVEHGLLMTDLGIEKLDEWSSDGTDGWGAEIVGQLLLMAAERGAVLGYSGDDMVRFLRAAVGSGQEVAHGRSR
ncbi:hypothetical protein ACFPWT_09745 [Streptomyces formicae]